MLKASNSARILQNRVSEKFKRARERHSLQYALREISKLRISIEKIIDVGAYKGEFSRKARKFFPEAQILLIEPNEEHNVFLKSEIVVNEILSDSVKEVDFFKLGTTGDSYFPEKTYLLSNVKKTSRMTTSLDLLLEQYRDFKSPHLIKLDTQGSEIEILKGAKEALRSTKVVICEIPVVEYNKGAATFDECIEFFLDSDFLPWRISEIHSRKNILIQLDVVFLSKKEHSLHFGASRVNQVLW